MQLTTCTRFHFTKHSWRENFHVVRRPWCLPAGGATRPRPPAPLCFSEPMPGEQSTSCSGQGSQAGPESGGSSDVPPVCSPWAPWSSDFLECHHWSETRTPALSSSMPSPRPAEGHCYPGLSPRHAAKTAYKRGKQISVCLKGKKMIFVDLNQPKCNRYLKHQVSIRERWASCFRSWTCASSHIWRRKILLTAKNVKCVTTDKLSELCCPLNNHLFCYVQSTLHSTCRFIMWQHKKDICFNHSPVIKTCFYSPCSTWSNQSHNMIWRQILRCNFIFLLIRILRYHTLLTITLSNRLSWIRSRET